MDRESLVERFSLFRSGSSGIGTWITRSTDSRVLDRLLDISNSPLSKAQFNQLLVLGQEAPVTFSFFRYYWLQVPDHFYDVRTVAPFDKEWIETGSKTTSIISIDHLYWGLYRFFVDALLLFGNPRTAFRVLRTRKGDDLKNFFQQQRFNTEQMIARGPSLPLSQIPKDDRYLIAEMACKSLGGDGKSISELGNALAEGWHHHERTVGGRATVKQLLGIEAVRSKYKETQQQLEFSADELMDKSVGSMEEVLSTYKQVYDRFTVARAAASKNTELYLSMVNELDAYVATSMRKREDFRAMATTCDRIFGDPSLRALNLRYFDPTLSAADGHEDKGLIECLMVKCAKVLLYTAGLKESYGKDAEAAMALSLGKPVIFLCDEAQKSRFYRDVHPLSRLISFQTGVAVGAMVTDDASQACELLRRLFFNQMEFELEQHPQRPGYLRLKERLTKSIVRLHTDDELLASTFWNHYNQRPPSQQIVAHF